jgi:hypothetical protein
VAAGVSREAAAETMLTIALTVKMNADDPQATIRMLQDLAQHMLARSAVRCEGQGRNGRHDERCGKRNKTRRAVKLVSLSPAPCDNARQTDHAG